MAPRVAMERSVLRRLAKAGSVRILGAALVALTVSAQTASCSDGDADQKSSESEARGGMAGAAPRGEGGAAEANNGGTGTTRNEGLAGNDGFGGQPGITGGGPSGGTGGGPSGGAGGGPSGGSGGRGGGSSGGTAGSPSSYVCSPACGEGQICCPIGVRTECVPIDADGCNVPDLVVTESETTSTFGIEFVNADADPCLLEEACVGGPGRRRVLVFNARTLNIGSGDLIVGSPSPTNMDFAYSACHGHYHFSDFATYDLLDESGNVAAAGHKQSYCVRDEKRVLNEPWVSQKPVYDDCGGGLQGISRGWSDVYKVGLDCQWVDITAVPAGSYFLRVRVNPDRRIYELAYDNNEIIVAVIIPP